jgi:hypothetical protein
MIESASTSAPAPVGGPVDKPLVTCRARQALVRRAAERKLSLARLSAGIGRNPAYLQQFVTRGSPKRLAEDDRRVLATLLCMPEAELREPARPAPAAPTAPVTPASVDEESFVEEFARELWEGSDDRSWDEAGDYWRDAYRKQGRLAAGILKRRGLLG